MNCDVLDVVAGNRKILIVFGDDGMLDSRCKNLVEIL